jgi:hypothetical protein
MKLYAPPIKELETQRNGGSRGFEVSGFALENLSDHFHSYPDK